MSGVKSIRQLVEYLEKQMSYKDAREPGCLWITNELKKYLESIDTQKGTSAEDFIGDDFDKVMDCEWCKFPLNPGDRFVVVMDGMGRFKVCPQCLNEYANNKFDDIISRMKQVRE